MQQYKKILMSAVAGAVLLGAGAVSAQAVSTGAYVMADGTRTNDYAAATRSWREDSMFKVDYSKAYLGLEHAYARGLTGAGVHLGLVDGGVHFDHPLFAGAGKIRGITMNATREFGNNGQVNPRLIWQSHGTHVAGTMAGNRIKGGQMFGNAFNATLVSATANFVSGDFLGAYGVALGLGPNIAEDALEALIIEGKARIINNSWGAGSILAPSNEAVTAIMRNNQLIVASAGNSSGALATGITLRPVVAQNDSKNLYSHYLIVTNYQQNDTASPTTSYCGLTATYCVTGPGHDIVSSIRDIDGDTARFALRNLDFASYQVMVKDIRTVSDVNKNAVNIYTSELNEFVKKRKAALDSKAAWDEVAERRTIARRGAVLAMMAGTVTAEVQPNGAAYDIGNAVMGAAFVNVFGRDYLGNLLRDMEAYRSELIDLYFVDKGMGYKAFTGTSMSGPNIAGFAALLAEAFPEYNTSLLTDIITSSSRDIGAPGVDAVTGWGVPQMGTALNGPTALRAVREVDVALGTVDIWTNNIEDAKNRYAEGIHIVGGAPHIGGLTKVGGGELVLAGAVTYTGATQVVGGLLTVNGSISASQTSVAQTGIIGGTGRLANLTAQSGGVVAPGNTANPFGTLTVTGNATFEPGSYLWVRSAVNGTQYSKLSIGNKAILNGGNVIVKADQGTWNLRTKDLRILTASGGVTGTFAGVSSDLAFLKPTLTYQNNSILLNLERNDYSIAEAGENRNQRAVGAALDDMTRQTTGNLVLEDAILDSSLESIKLALPGLGGEVHASLAGVALGDSRFIRNAILERGRGAAHMVQAINHSGVYAWASGTFGQGHYDGSKQFSKFSSRSGGFAAGIDAGNDRGLIGVAFGETNTRLERHKLANNADVTSRQLGLYGATTVRGFNIRAGGALTKTDSGVSRSVSLNSFSDRLVSDYEGDGWQAFGELSWLTSVRGSSVEPYVNYAHVSYEADVREKGDEAALSGKVTDKADLLTVGIRTNTKLAGGEVGRPRLTLVGHLAWTEDFNEGNPLFRARFEDSPAFSVRGKSVAGEGLSTGIGVNVQATERAALDFGYSGSHTGNYSDNRLFARMSVKF